MNKKKKVLVIALAVSMFAIAVGGTLAWFMDEDETTNVFTVGSVDIEQNEVFNQDTAQLLPVVGTDPTNGDDNYIQKKVTVSNIGKNGAYVQTFVAVPAVLDDNGILKLYDINHATNGWTKIDGDEASDGIQPVAKGVTIENALYNVYLYRYNTELLAPTEAQQTSETLPCLEYVYIDKTIDLDVVDENEDGTIEAAYFVLADGTTIKSFDATGELNVYVATQSVQARGFADEDAAFTEAYGNPAETHPWTK